MEDFLSLPTLFKLQAQRTPKQIALVDRTNSITYQKLDQLTDNLAGYLQEQGVNSNQPVGVLLGKSQDYIIACLAILKARGAFIPLELKYPDTLLAKILEDAQVSLIITKSEYSPRLSSELSRKILSIDREAIWNLPSSPDQKLPSIAPHDLANIIYTSGSTGEPKGILLSHQAIISGELRREKISPSKSGYSIAYVLFPWEIFRPWIKGTTLYIIPDEILCDHQLFLDFISQKKIKEITISPSLIQSIVNTVEVDYIVAKLSALEVVWLTGEAVSKKLKNQLQHILPSTRLLNYYGLNE